MRRAIAVIERVGVVESGDDFLDAGATIDR
jgi:hypothetical protein